jgi:hypothetical protein
MVEGHFGVSASPRCPFVVGFLLIGSLLNAPLTAQVGRQIITSNTLRYAGITRISDLLLLADNWHVSTIDGYTWRAAASGLNHFDDQAWTIMLDGQRMDLKTMDVINLNALPVDLAKIDSVVIISAPQLHYGEFTDKGLIHIYSKIPARGLSALGHYYGGNETGDPGPYLYTPYRTTNVDRIGFDESLSVDIARNNWFARVFLLWQTHTFSDYALHRRIKRTIDEWAGLSLYTALCRLGFNSAHGRHELTAGYSYGDKQRVFFIPLGREFPTSHHAPRIGLNGYTRSASGKFDIEYRLQFSRNTLGESPNLLNFDYGWSLQTITAAVQGIFQKAKHRAALGAGFDHFNFIAQPAVLDPAYSIGKVFSEISFTRLGPFRPSCGIMLITCNGKEALKTSLSNLWSINSRNSIGAAIAYSRRLFEEDNSYWYWTQMGYRVFENHNVEYSLSGNLDQDARLTADITWSLAIKEGLALTTTVFYRHLGGMVLERHSYQFEPDTCAFISPVNVVGDFRGKIGGIWLTLNHSPRPAFTHRIHYSYQTALSGGLAFRDALRAIPEHAANYRITWVPLQNFAIWAMFSYRSSSTYSDYQDVGAQTCRLTRLVQPAYSPRLNSTAIIDLSVKKWFWKRRISGQIILRNIMNEDLRYHPVGAGFGLSMLIQVNVLLDATDQLARHDAW